MRISLIAAVDDAGGIGKDGALPWHLSDDLKNFKRLTMDHHVIMGRKTFESIDSRLPGRKLIVLSRDEKYSAKDVRLAHSLEEAFEIARQAQEDEVFIIGGAELFAQVLPLSQRIYLTRVLAEVVTDTQFPDFEESEWQELESISFEAGPKNDYAFTIQVLERS